MTIRDAGIRRYTLLFLTTAAIASAQPQTYTIRLSPPVEAGKTYTVSTTGLKEQKASIGDRIIRQEDYRIAFEGKAQVVEVDSRARPVKIIFTVDKFTKEAAGVTADVLKEGTVIVADGSQDPPISLKDGPMEKSIREAFDLVYSPHKPNEPTDDDVFGAEEPKSIGQKWSINRALAVQGLKDRGIIVPADGLNGTVSLDAKDKLGAIDCLNVRGEFNADGITSAGLPPGVTLEAASLKAVFRGCFPVEASGLYAKGGFDMIVNLRVSNGENMIDSIITEKWDAVWTPVEH